MAKGRNIKKGKLNTPKITLKEKKARKKENRERRSSRKRIF